MTQHAALPVGIHPWPNSEFGPLSEGFQYDLLEDCDNAYRFNIVADVDKIAALFKEFARFLGDEAFFILEYYPDDIHPLRADENSESPAPVVYYSPYQATGLILNTVLPYLPRMIHDGFVGFGLANNRKSLEFFYSEEKVITCFTDNHLRLSDFFSQHGIGHQQELVLPTDFGHNHLSLLNIPRRQLPEQLSSLPSEELDSSRFCQLLCESLEMYEVEEGLSFFLTRKEQLEINRLIEQELPHFEFVEADFGGLLLDWSDFVTECEQGFSGDLGEYRQGLRVRDSIQMVIELAEPPLADKIAAIVAEPDELFQDILTDRRKRLDPPSDAKLNGERFWYQGMVSKPGSCLRRDLIRQGWFKS